MLQELVGVGAYLMGRGEGECLVEVRFGYDNLNVPQHVTVLTAGENITNKVLVDVQNFLA